MAVADTLGAFLHPLVERPGRADGPLSGLSFAAKDIFDVAGDRTGAGNPDWLRTHGPATADAWAVARLLAAGVRLVGKTITDELAFSLAGENDHYGTPLNPACPDRIPGGSSSGSASAVAGGAADTALGSDTGGSIRAPASYCGIWGMRPTHGAVPLDGVMPLAPSFDTVGWFARDAETLARVGAVLLPEVSQPPALKTAIVPQDAEALLEPEHADDLWRHTNAMAEAVGSCSMATLAPEGLDVWRGHFQALQWREIRDTHQAWIDATRPRFGPVIAGRFAGVGGITDAQVADADAFRRTVRNRVDQALGDGVIVLPTVPGPAPLKGLDEAAVTAVRGRSLALLCVAGLCGLPQISIPAVMLGGCPAGISIIGPRDSDRSLLTLAVRLAGAIADGVGAGRAGQGGTA